jgi:hypothetical protein
MTDNHLPEPPKEPSLEDVGTRFEHLQDHFDSLAAVIDVMKRRQYLSANDKQKIVHLQIAADVMRATIDSYAGWTDSRTEYALYRIINGVSVKPEEIQGGRGTPLI